MRKKSVKHSSAKIEKKSIIVNNDNNDILDKIIVPIDNYYECIFGNCIDCVFFEINVELKCKCYE